MTVLTLVPKTDPILVKPVESFNFVDPPEDPVEIAKNLAETMLFHNGLGLAANQVGLPYRVFVIKAEPIICAFNPHIVDVSHELIEMEEGCLTFPGLFLKIKRPKSIRIRFTMPNTDVITQIYTGMTARVVQHEYDHLQGKLFTEEVTTLELALARA